MPEIIINDTEKIFFLNCNQHLVISNQVSSLKPKFFYVLIIALLFLVCVYSLIVPVVSYLRLIMYECK